MYTRFLVSTKIAIYSHDFTQVMIMKYPDRYGLPGGHLEKGETPDQAIARELEEELGVTISPMKRTDFFLRGIDGKTVILGYTAIAPKGFIAQPSRPQKEHDIWVGREEVSAIDMSEGYKQLILENWPEAV